MTRREFAVEMRNILMKLLYSNQISLFLKEMSSRQYACNSIKIFKTRALMDVMLVFIKQSRSSCLIRSYCCLKVYIKCIFKYTKNRSSCHKRNRICIYLTIPPRRFAWILKMCSFSLSSLGDIVFIYYKSEIIENQARFD